MLLVRDRRAEENGRRLKFIKFKYMTREPKELKNIKGELPYMTEEMHCMTREVGYSTWQEGLSTVYDMPECSGL
jgi:hypothetical protein